MGMMDNGLWRGFCHFYFCDSPLERQALQLFIFIWIFMRYIIRLVNLQKHSLHHISNFFPLPCKTLSRLALASISEYVGMWSMPSKSSGLIWFFPRESDSWCLIILNNRESLSGVCWAEHIEYFIFWLIIFNQLCSVTEEADRTTAV